MNSTPKVMNPSSNNPIFSDPKLISNLPTIAASALIQAAFSKAAWTNVMLAEAVSVVGFAGFTSTGACSLGDLFSHQLSCSRAAARTESQWGYVGFVQ